MLDVSKSHEFGKVPIKEIALNVELCSEGSWDFTLPGRLYSLIKEDFPQKSFSLSADTHVGSFSPDENIPAAPPPFMAIVEKDVRARINAMAQFSSSGRCIQVGHNLLVINYMGDDPYWNRTLKNFLRKGLDAYCRVISDEGRDVVIRRLGLQYVNFIEVPGSEVELSEYFRCFPEVPEELGASHGAFQMNVTIPRDSDTKERLEVFVELRSGKAVQEKHVAVWLRIHVSCDHEPRPCTLDKIMSGIEQAHGEAKRAFLSIITERTYELLQGRPAT